MEQNSQAGPRGLQQASFESPSLPPGPHLTVHQPDFLPWAGFWARAALSERVVLMTGVPYSKGDVTGRVKIDGQWVSLPVLQSRGDFIRDLQTTAHGVKKALKTLELRLMSRSENPYRQRLEGVRDLMARAVQEGELIDLSALNIALISEVVKVLGIGTELREDSGDLVGDTKTQRLSSIIRRNTDQEFPSYLAGFGGLDYLEPTDSFRVTFVSGEYPDASIAQLIAREPDPLGILMRHLVVRGA